jgi:predicted secreted Zn-dependent protease
VHLLDRRRDAIRRPVLLELSMLAIRLALTALVTCLGIQSAGTEPLISKSYSYYSVSGQTSAELESELWRSGPELAETGIRHPGATRIKMSRTISFEETPEPLPRE